MLSIDVWRHAGDHHLGSQQTQRAMIVADVAQQRNSRTKEGDSSSILSLPNTTIGKSFAKRNSHVAAAAKIGGESHCWWRVWLRGCCRPLAAMAVVLADRSGTTTQQPWSKNIAAV